MAGHGIGGQRARSIRADLWGKQGGRCCYCEAEFDPRPNSNGYATIEHLVDRAKGGVNARENLALACFACNQRAAREGWSPDYKRHRMRVANLTALAVVEVEHMELPPLYLQQVGRAA